MKSIPLQRSPVAPRCPRQPTIGRSRFDVGREPPDRRSFAWMTALAFVLAVFRPAGESRRVSRKSRVLPPSQIMRRRCSQVFGDVPLSTNGSRDLIGHEAGTCLPRTDGAPGVMPFAVLILLAGGDRVSAPPGPRAICLNVLLDILVEGSAAAIHTITPPCSLFDGRSGTSRSASGIWPREQSGPADFRSGRYCLGLSASLRHSDHRRWVEHAFDRASSGDACEGSTPLASHRPPERSSRLLSTESEA